MNREVDDLRPATERRSTNAARRREGFMSHRRRVALKDRRGARSALQGYDRAACKVSRQAGQAASRDLRDDVILRHPDATLMQIDRPLRDRSRRRRIALTAGRVRASGRRADSAARTPASSAAAPSHIGRDHGARSRVAPHRVRARLDDGARGGHDLEREGHRLRRRRSFERSGSSPPARTAPTSRPCRTFARATRRCRAGRRETSSRSFRGSDPALRGEYVAITAHNDHIGFTHRPVDHDSIRAFNIVMRPLGADSPPRAPTPDEVARIRRDPRLAAPIHAPRLDSISNGADDDGSGTVALIELAEAFAKGGVQAAPLDPLRVAHRRGKRTASARRGTPITRPCRSIRSSPRSTST